MSVKLIIEVNAGIIPHEPMPEHRKLWSLTYEQTRDAEQWRRAHGEAVMYMLALQNPGAINWVRLDWIWV